MEKKLSEKQKKIARMAPPPDKITGADFKAMKAKDGKEIKKDPTKPVNPFQKTPKTTSKLPGRIGTALGIGAMMVPAAYAAAKQYKDYKSAKNRDKAKVKKMGGGMMNKPMGYKSGTMVKARGCKLGRTRPTKIT